MKNPYFCDPETNTAIIYCRQRNADYIEVLIDADDLPLFTAHPGWWAVGSVDTRPTRYCFHSSDGKTTYAHRLVTSCPDGLVVDHLNGNSLDNRRQNLECVTQRENIRRSFINRREKGITRHCTVTAEGKYRVSIGGNRRTFTSIDAAVEYARRFRS